MRLKVLIKNGDWRLVYWEPRGMRIQWRKNGKWVNWPGAGLYTDYSGAFRTFNSIVSK